MPKRLLIRSASLPYHVVNRVNNREWLQLPMPQAWSLFAHFCKEISEKFDARIHAAVLMSNHYHMLLTTPGPDLGVVMQHFSRSLTKTYNLKTGRDGHLFRGVYKWSLIESAPHYANVFKYVYRNPVKAGVVERVEHYDYGTLMGLLGACPLPFPIHQPMDGAGDGLLHEDMRANLPWLNTPFRNEDDQAIREALQRRRFGFSRNRRSRRPSHMDSARA